MDGGNERGNAERGGNSAFGVKPRGGGLFHYSHSLLNPHLNTPVCTGCARCGKFYSEWEGLKTLFLMEKRWIQEKRGVGKKGVREPYSFGVPS